MIGELIGLYLRVNNITAKQLADSLGVSASTVSSLIAGGTCNQATTLKLINWLFQEKSPQTEMKLG